LLNFICLRERSPTATTATTATTFSLSLFPSVPQVKKPRNETKINQQQQQLGKTNK